VETSTEVFVMWQFFHGTIYQDMTSND